MFPASPKSNRQIKSSKKSFQSLMSIIRFQLWTILMKYFLLIISSSAKSIICLVWDSHIMNSSNTSRNWEKAICLILHRNWNFIKPEVILFWSPLFINQKVWNILLLLFLCRIKDLNLKMRMEVLSLMKNMDLFLLLLRRIRILFESNVQEIIPKRMLMEKEKYGIPIRKTSSNLFFLSF